MSGDLDAELLQGERVFLRPVESTDLDLLVDWRNAPDNWTWFFNKFPLVRSQQSQWYGGLLSSQTRKLFMICLREGRKPIGTVGIDAIDPHNQHCEIGNVLLGTPEHRGKGLATEAVKLLTTFCFRQLNMHRLYLYVLAENMGARRLYERAGYKTEGTLRQHVFARGAFCDVLLLARLRGEE